MLNNWWEFVIILNRKFFSSLPKQLNFASSINGHSSKTLILIRPIFVNHFQKKIKRSLFLVNLSRQILKRFSFLVIFNYSYYFLLIFKRIFTKQSIQYNFFYMILVMKSKLVLFIIFFLRCVKMCLIIKNEIDYGIFGC